jgi:hypothetical protein
LNPWKKKPKKVGKKQKKVRKDLERLFRTNRYWEWLAIVDQRELAGQLSGPYEMAWHTLIRKALRTAQGFEEWCEKAPTLRRPVRARDQSLLPDYTFLMGLWDFLEGKKNARDMTAPKGLSPPARALCEGVSHIDPDGFPETAIRRLLRPFVEKPQSVTRRQYNELAKALKSSSMEKPVREMGGMLAQLREITGKRAVGSPPDARLDDRFSNLDEMCAMLGRSLPGPLSMLLTLPLCWRLADFIAELPSPYFSERVARLASSMPFLFPRMVGEKAEAVNRALSFTGKGFEQAQSFARLGGPPEKAAFEDQVKMLGVLRRSVRQKETPEDLELDLFEELFVEDEEPQEQRALRLTYEAILEGIELRKKSLGMKERRELAAFMDRIGAEDIPFLMGGPDDANQLASLLMRFIRAGCAGRQLSLLALVAGRRSRTHDLERSAREILKESGPMEKTDLRRFLERSKDLYFPHLSAMIPVFDLLGEDQDLWDLVVSELVEGAESAILADVAMDRSPFFWAFRTEGAGFERTMGSALRKELNGLGAYPQIEPLRAFMNCFPKGFVKGGYYCWLTYLRQERRHVPWLVEKVPTIGGALEVPDIVFDVKPIQNVFRDQLADVVRFLTEHADDFAHMETEAAWKILFPLLPHAAKAPHGGALLLKTLDIFEKRAHEGDEGAARISAAISGTLRVLRGRVRRPRGGRKERRRL